jgi:hypothetical protein
MPRICRACTFSFRALLLSLSSSSSSFQFFFTKGKERKKKSEMWWWWWGGLGKTTNTRKQTEIKKPQNRSFSFTLHRGNLKRGAVSTNQKSSLFSVDLAHHANNNNNNNK